MEPNNNTTRRLLLEAMAMAYAHKNFALWERINKHLAQLPA